MKTDKINTFDSRAVPLTRDELPANLWSGKVTFRHGQCDPAGIAYTPQFFNIFNQVIEDWFCNRLGINYYEILGPRRIGLGYVNASANFFAPCEMGDEIEIFIKVVHVGGKSYQLVLHAMKDGKEALRGFFTTVTTSLETHSSVPIPTDIRNALQDYSEATETSQKESDPSLSTMT